jgi:hypothetical protein
MGKTTIKKYQLNHLGSLLSKGLTVSNPTVKAHDRMKYALSRTWGKIKDAYEELVEDVAHLQREYALEGAGGEILRDKEGRYCYTKEAEGKLEFAMRNLMQEEIELDLYTIEDDPSYSNPNTEAGQIRNLLLGTIVVQGAAAYKEGESEEDYLKRQPARGDKPVSPIITS